MRFDGQTVLVTGAARGIGLAIAERLLAEGARVALVDRDAEVEAVAKRLGAATRGLVADVTVTTEVDRAVGAAHAWADRLDVVVNNAGITGRSYPIWELSDADWQQVIAVDLTSVFLVCRAAVKLMLPRQYGRIVNIASIAGKEGNPTLVPYSTAKAGVIGLTKALAKEVATKGILVHAVAPAVIGTDDQQDVDEAPEPWPPRQRARVSLSHASFARRRCGFRARGLGTRLPSQRRAVSAYWRIATFEYDSVISSAWAMRSASAKGTARRSKNSSSSAGRGSETRSRAT